MRKYWNTMKYGTGKARLIVCLSFLCAVFAVAGIAAAIVFGQVLLIFAAIVCVFAAAALMQTLEISGGANVHVPEEDLSGTNLPGTDASDAHRAGAPDTSVADAEPRKRNRRGSQDAGTQKQNHRRSQDEKTRNRVRRERHKGVTTAEVDGISEAEETDKTPAQTPSGDMTSEDGHDMREIPHVRNTGEDREHTDKPKTEITPLTEETIHRYDRRKVKKTMHRYKVRRDHRRILVDRSDRLQIRQTPAYIWVYDREFHLLLIEEEPRHITIPLYQITGITYRKKQIADEENDYAAFREKSVLADLFRPYLPDYLHTATTSDLTAYKNLYGVSDLFYVTNRSASALFDLLGVEFLVDDRVTMSKKVNIYFKDAYKSNILLRDGVVDANGYADRISRILDSLAHSTVGYAEFKDTLNLMIRNKLITQEFAEYYMDIRNNLTK